MLYGVLAVAGAQFCYFSAVRTWRSGPALLIEYTAPAAVVVWLWLRHGQRPGPLTLRRRRARRARAGARARPALRCRPERRRRPVGAGRDGRRATYFVISADEDNGLPPMALAAGGLVVGAVRSALLGLVGLLPMHASTATRRVRRPHGRLVGAAGAARPGHRGRLPTPPASPPAAGSAPGWRRSSRCSRSSRASLFAWLLLDELPRPVQLLGGLLILAGVVGVKLGEPAWRRRTRPPAEKSGRGCNICGLPRVSRAWMWG